MASTPIRSHDAPRPRGAPVWLALTVAPPTVALPVALAFVAVHSPTATAFTYISVCVALALLSLAATWSLGLAWHVYAIRRGWRRARTYAWAGAVVGAGLTAAIVALVARPGYNLLVGVLIVAWFGIWGMLAGSATAWFIWFMRRPDRDAVTNIAAEFD